MGLIPSGNNMVIAVAGSENDIPIGKGIAYTGNIKNSPINWLYHNQPADKIKTTYPPYDIVATEGRQGLTYFSALPITVIQANVTYDIAVTEKFIWTANWAGGLRRLPSQDTTASIWERMPLPMDDQFELITCDEFDSNGDPTYIEVYKPDLAAGKGIY